VKLPPSPGQPGDPVERFKPPTVRDYLVRTVGLVRSLLDAIRVRSTTADRAAAEAQAPRATDPAVVAAAMARFLRYGELLGLQAVVEALRVMEQALAATPSVANPLLLTFHGAVMDAARDQIARCVGADDEVRRLWEIADVAMAVVRGSIKSGLATDPRGFGAIDDVEWRDWLRDNGASDAALDGAFVRALYDLVFAYENGDVNRPRIGAGQALRGSMRAFFTYRGAFFWKMHAGMGDVVFAPFYEALRARGVRFEFFHRLRDVSVGEDGERPYVSALTFDVQAQVENGRAYQPLVDVHGLPCWPSEPDWDQLVDGARLRREGWAFERHDDERRAATKRLEVTRDFSYVVMAVGLGAIPHVCGGILRRDARWRDMVERVATVGTQALQLWLKPSMRELGWTHGPVSLSGFVEPFDTWADMSHLAGAEAWPRPPGSIAYFCSVLPDAQTGPEAVNGVRDSAVRFLERDLGHLWPRAANRDGFRWETLMAPPEGAAPRKRGQRRERGAAAAAAASDRLAGLYCRANVEPSDRYVLSLPDTDRYRISPLDDTYDNLTVAGDWTDCGLNMGCVEAAVMSGRLASHALSQNPPLEEIVGFDHP
jgi:uncharacterized protein with NAD-binding domain and iron-sulfur cluster